jgi:mannan endo-1,4-beta-mannosidase
MVRRLIVFAACALVTGAAIFLVVKRKQSRTVPPGFVTTDGPRFVVDGRPFRFVGANVAVMYREEDRARMPETLRLAAQDGIRVVRVWAHGEGSEDGSDDVGSVGGDRHDWPRQHPFRRAPGVWVEESFVHLDRVIAEAARNNLRVQLCLANWWRDTGGVTQYLRWAGIHDAADDRQPFGINVELAMQFYTNEETRRLYREHVEKIVLRRNTVTGLLYRDDPTIFAYELMNEAQAPTGRWAERRAWVEEMSRFIKSLDPNHLVVPGTWGYRISWERREWLAEHRIPTVDYCDVHNYPRDDLDSFVDSPPALGEFIDNRAAAAYSLNKPLVMGEFGMGPEGYKGFSPAAWFRAYFEGAARAGAAGAIFWIWTPDPRRGYGITYTTPRDEAVRAEIRQASAMFAARSDERPPPRLLDAGHHLIPRQFAFARPAGDPWTIPKVVVREDGTLLYRFAPEQAASGRFEKLDGGQGYIWGAGAGYFEYIVPARADRGMISEVVVRAHLKFDPPYDAHGRIIHSRVTLFVNGTNCGARLVPIEKPPAAVIQEWRVDALAVRWQAMRGQPLKIRFAVEPEADLPYGLNISNFPYDAGETAPVEVEVRK